MSNTNKTQGERIASLELIVNGNGVQGLGDKVSVLEKQLVHDRMLLVATCVAALLGGFDGVIKLVSMVLEVL